jgi:hypothetical protein
MKRSYEKSIVGNIMILHPGAIFLVMCDPSMNEL